MFCPICRYEYNDDIYTCPDCGAELVDELPEIQEEEKEPEEPEEEWVEIGKVTSLQYAQMALEALRSKGIPAVILSGAGYFGESGLYGIQSYLSNSGAYQIMVAPDYVEDADGEMEILFGEMWAKSRTTKT